MARPYPLVLFEGVPQLAKDGLVVGLAGSSLRKEDDEAWVVRGGLVPPLPLYHGV